VATAFVAKYARAPDELRHWTAVRATQVDEEFEIELMALALCWRMDFLASRLPHARPIQLRESGS
jgi:hypothetical protein